jgi:hypothetical protein
MAGDGIKFSSKRPKGTKWGVADAVTLAADEFRETGHTTLIPCMAFLAVDNVKLTPGDDDEPTVEITVRVAAIESLDTQDARKKAHLIVLKESQRRLGKGGQPTLPFELKEMFDQVFGGRSFEEVEQDEKEADMDAGTDDPTRLRHHLAAVHGHELDDVLAMEWADVRTLHDSDHERDEADGMPPHSPEWWAWRRVDIEAAEAEADETSDEKAADDVIGDRAEDADDDTADTDGSDNVTPLFKAESED